LKISSLFRREVEIIILVLWAIYVAEGNRFIDCSKIRRVYSAFITVLSITDALCETGKKVIIKFQQQTGKLHHYEWFTIRTKVVNEKKSYKKRREKVLATLTDNR
jgi:hypothetical protein